MVVTLEIDGLILFDVISSQLLGFVLQNLHNLKNAYFNASFTFLIMSDKFLQAKEQSQKIMEKLKKAQSSLNYFLTRFNDTI